MGAILRKGFDNMSILAVQSHIAHRTSHIAHRTSSDLLPSSGRIQEVDALRGFAIFLVVLGHAIILFPVNLHENLYCNFLLEWIYSFHMPLLFTVSGFCFSCRDYKSYLHKKFLRLAIPYIVFNLIDMLPRQLLASLVRRPRPFTESLVKILLYGGEFWFLYTLFIIFMIYPLIHRLVSSSRIRMLALAVILFLLSLYGLETRIFLAGRVSYYLFFFHVGVCAKYFLGGRRPSLRVPVYVLPVCLGLWLAMLCCVKGFGVITAILGILTCLLLTRYTLFNRTFSRFGEYSLQIYLLNGLTLGLSRAIICNIFHVYNPAAIILFNMLVDFLASYLFIKYLCTKNRVIRYAMGIV